MTVISIPRTRAEEAILSQGTAAASPPWGGEALAHRRRDALTTLAARGLPSRRVEDWKYTDLRALMHDFSPPFEAHNEDMVERALGLSSSLDRPKASRILFVCGKDFTVGKHEGFEWSRLAEGGGSASRVAAALGRERFYAGNAAVALNTAFMKDCTVLRIPTGTKLEKPLHLVFHDMGDAPFSAFTRVLILVEEGASATIVETHDGPSGLAYQTNTMIEFELGKGAEVRHIRHEGAGDAALSLSTLGVRLGERAKFSSFSMVTGAAVSRHQMFLSLEGEDAAVSLNGATLLRARQHADATLVADHMAPGGTSRELFKAVIDDDARSVFQGKIIVRPGAQKTDGRMMSRALLLSDTAEADNKPELEIFADDVQCGHGATCGALDEDLLFYCKSRGLPKAEAEALLIQAFVGEAIETVEDEDLRASLNNLAANWLAGRR